MSRTYWCWKKGTSWKDGVRYTVDKPSDAVKQFCDAWNLADDEVECQLHSELIK